MLGLLLQRLNEGGLIPILLPICYTILNFLDIDPELFTRSILQYLVTECLGQWASYRDSSRGSRLSKSSIAVMVLVEQEKSHQ